MTTKITWTHVDSHVRQQCERVGMLPIGATDAEVAYNYLKYVESQIINLERLAEGRLETLETLRAGLKAKEAKPVKIGKTKRRLDALEKAVAELQKQHVSNSGLPFGKCNHDGWYALEKAVADLQRKPVYLPFPIVSCANRTCTNLAREISPYCDKCEPDL